MCASSSSPSPALPRLPVRLAESHKGDYGRALLVGGSRGMTGAIALAGMAALRGGAGLVTLAVPDVCVDAVAAHEPSYMTLPLPSDGEGRIALSARELIERQAERATCMACGPGLGRSEELTELACWMHRSLPLPIVFDADGLNALSAGGGGLGGKAGPRVLTPHPGEFRRLCGGSGGPEEDQAARAERIAADQGVVMVLKGHRTLTTDGRLAARNETGNPGMATGGSGDVLTGLITALICQGLAPFEAARLGVYLHGLAGDLAAERLGQASLIASDLVGFLAPAMRRIESSSA